MPDTDSSIKVLREEFPEAEIGVDRDRPYARTVEGLYGILFGEDHVGDPKWARGPVAIVKFPTGQIDGRHFEVVRFLKED